MRLILVTGQKGGVGKTTFTHILTNYLTQAKVRWRGLDTDQENKGFADIYPDQVNGITLYTSEGRLVDETINSVVDEIANAMESGDIDVFVCDMGAGQLNAFMGALRETGLISEVGGQLRMTCAYVIVGTIEILSTLMGNHTLFDDVPAIQWMVVKNEKEGSLSAYDESRELRPAMLSRRAVEVEMPAIADKTVLPGWSRSGLTLAAFLEPSNKMPFSARGRLSAWLKAMHSELDRVSEVLR